VADELAAINSYEPALSAYRRLTMPVTLLLGDQNDGKPPYGTAFATFAAALPQARVVGLTDQGHLAHAEAPGQLGHAITDAVVRAQ
jgi:pimeloyl-ACP methyl ester carboxylesterase